MFRLLKLGFALVGFMAFAWFGATVKLGSQTLFQHLRAIGQTKESQELVDGTRQAAEPLVDDVRRRISGKEQEKEKQELARKESADGGAPEERVSAADRQALHRLIRRVDR
ncbi:MAG TPA: hypothetical protein VHG72_07780 [Polyangia bacterium]|nr:hypothetical protein [Polyangia bacterium]